MPSFDAVVEPNRVELRNAIDQCVREIGTRFDFKNTNSTIDLGDSEITIESNTEDRLDALRQVLEEKFVKRKVSLKVLDYQKVQEASGGKARQVAKLQAGINSEKARALHKFIKEAGLKGISSSTQGDQVRVSGKKRDDLQSAISALRDGDFGIPLQFENFRD